MLTLNLRLFIFAVVAAAALGACSSSRSEAMKPQPSDSTAQQLDPSPAPPPSSHSDAGAPDCASCGPHDQCLNGRCVCQPLTCSSGGKRCGQVSDGCGGVLDCGHCSRCAPDEMDCCGICIPRSEKRCPENVHCPTPPPEM